jgi:hypothetical protein
VLGAIAAAVSPAQTFTSLASFDGANGSLPRDADVLNGDLPVSENVAVTIEQRRWS